MRSRILALLFLFLGAQATAFPKSCALALASLFDGARFNQGQEPAEQKLTNYLRKNIDDIRSFKVLVGYQQIAEFRELAKLGFPKKGKSTLISGVLAGIVGSSEYFEPVLEPMSSFQAAYRGFSTVRYHDVDLLHLMLGDTSKEISSHRRSRLIQKKLDQGVPLSQSILEANETIAKSVLRSIRKHGCFDFASNELDKTNIACPNLSAQRNANAMAFSFRIEDYAYHYAVKNLIRRKVDNEPLEQRQGIVVKLRNLPLWLLPSPPSTTGAMGGMPEAVMLSRLSVHDLDGAFIGYPKGKTEKQIKWYYLKLTDRNSSGSAGELTLYHAKTYEPDFERGMGTDKKLAPTRMIARFFNRVERPFRYRRTFPESPKPELQSLWKEIAKHFKSVDLRARPTSRK